MCRKQNHCDVGRGFLVLLIARLITSTLGQLHNKRTSLLCKSTLLSRQFGGSIVSYCDYFQLGRVHSVYGVSLWSTCVPCRVLFRVISRSYSEAAAKQKVSNYVLGPFAKIGREIPVAFPQSKYWKLRSTNFAVYK